MPSRIISQLWVKRSREDVALLHGDNHFELGCRGRRPCATTSAFRCCVAAKGRRWVFAGARIYSPPTRRPERSRDRDGPRPAPSGRSIHSIASRAAGDGTAETFARTSTSSDAVMIAGARMNTALWGDAVASAPSSSIPLGVCTAPGTGIGTSKLETCRRGRGNPSAPCRKIPHT